MTTLHDQVKAEVQRRLALAQAATPGPWRYDGNPSATVVGGEEGRSLCASAYNWPDPICAANATFIAAHDPADAIRRHEAALERLAEHPMHVCGGEGCKGLCTQCHDGDECPGPCAELRRIAGEYDIPIDDQEQP